MKRKLISGIYCIENIINEHKYIGYAKDINTRWNIHKSYLMKNKHRNRYLQFAWNKYGKDNFKFWIVEIIEYDLEKLNTAEINWIIFYSSYVLNGKGYNLTLGGGGQGHIFTEEYRKKISFANKGRILTEEHKENISKAHKNSQVSKDHMKKITSDNIGIKLSKEHRENISAGEQGIKTNKNQKYVGVRYKDNGWEANIGYRGDYIYLGRFVYEVEAALAYNEAALEFYGYKAKLNTISEEEIQQLWELE